MLNQTTKDKLKALGFDVDKLTAAVTHADEQEFEVPEIKQISDADLAIRDDNSKKEGKKEGKKDGIAIATKAIADKFNITDVDLSKPDSLIEKLNGHFTGGDAILKEQVKQLQADNGLLKTEKETAVKEVKGAMFDRELLTKFPANRTKLVNDGELLNLVKANLQFEEVDGAVIVKKNGVPLLDATTKNPLTVDAAIGGLFTERKWVDGDGTGGRGGGDHQNNGGGIKTLSKFQENWEKEGKNPISPEFHTALQAAIKATTDFDMNG